MIKTIHSESAFDVVKSSNKPKAASTEAADKGATFQSHYSAADKRESAVSEKKHAANADAVDDAQSTVANDVTAPAKPRGPEIDQEHSANPGEDLVAPDSVDVKVIPTQQNRPSVVSFSQGEGRNSEAAIQSTANENKVVEASQARADFVASQSTQSEGVEQSTRRSVAELRMTGLQQGSGADRNLPATDLAGQGVKISPQGSQEKTPMPNGVIDAGLKGEAAIASAQSSAQGIAPAVPESLQRFAASSQGARVISVTTVAPKSTQTGQNTQTTQQAIEQAFTATGQVTEPVLDAEPEPDSNTFRQGTEATPNRTSQVTAPPLNTTGQLGQAAQVAGQVSVASADANADTVGATLVLDPAGFEPAGLSQLLTEAVMSPGTTHRPETPRLVAAQMAEALATKGERNIDIALSPEELGRVKMRVSTTDSSVVVAITTERPETGEMMRRHINELSDEFRRMGFEDITFEFSGEGMTGDGNEQGESLSNGSSGDNNNGRSAENTQEPEQQNLRLGETGLDMRI